MLRRNGRRPGNAEIHPAQLGEWIDIFREMGVWAERHTSPDLIAQLYAALARPVDSILLNLLDVDPTVCLNAALMAAESPAIRAGVDVIARLTGATQLWAAIDQQAPADWTRGFCSSNGVRAACKLVPLANPYPQNDPSLLVYALINRRLRPKHSPVEVGAIVLDAARGHGGGQRGAARRAHAHRAGCRPRPCAKTVPFSNRSNRHVHRNTSSRPGHAGRAMGQTSRRRCPAGCCCPKQRRHKRQ